MVGGFAGSNPVKFMRAYADLGLEGEIPILAGWTAMDDALLRSLGDEAIGVISAHWYCRRFRFRRQQALRRRDAGAITACCPAAIRPACISRRSASKRRWQNSATRPRSKALAEALHQVTLTDTPRGPVRFDHMGNVDGRRLSSANASASNGALVNTIIKRYPNVSQFWTYDEKDFWPPPSTRAIIRPRKTWSRDFPLTSS